MKTVLKRKNGIGFFGTAEEMKVVANVFKVGTQLTDFNGSTEVKDFNFFDYRRKDDNGNSIGDWKIGLFVKFDKCNACFMEDGTRFLPNLVFKQNFDTLIDGQKPPRFSNEND